jgi:hypothetical protein
MRKTTLLALTAISAALFAQGAAHATTLPYKGVDKLVAEADGIVIGTVRQVQSTEESQKDIETYVTLDNLKVLGGRFAAPTLTLRLKGGRVDNEILFIDGTPQFKQDERVLMFVQGNGRDIVPLVGWTQGVFRLMTDKASGAMTIADHAGHPVVGFEGNRVLTSGVDADAHILGAPNADFVVHVAAPGQASAGKTNDGSASTMVEATVAKNAPPMAAEAFLSALQKRIDQRAAGASPFMQLESVELGVPAKFSHRDGVSPNARANAVVNAVQDSGQPQLPQRLAPPPAPGK